MATDSETPDAIGSQAGPIWTPSYPLSKRMTAAELKAIQQPDFWERYARFRRGRLMSPEEKQRSMDQATARLLGYSPDAESK